MEAFGDTLRSFSHLLGRSGPTDAQLLMMRMILNSIHAESRRRIYESTAPNHLELDSDSDFTTVGMYVDRMERRLFGRFPCLLLLEEDIDAFNWAVYLFTQCSYTAQGAANSAVELSCAGRRYRRHWRNVCREEQEYLRRVRRLRPQPINAAGGAFVELAGGDLTENQPPLAVGGSANRADRRCTLVEQAIGSVREFLNAVENLHNFVSSRPRFNITNANGFLFDDTAHDHGYNDSTRQNSTPYRAPSDAPRAVPRYLRDLTSHEVVPAIIAEFTRRVQRAPQHTADAASQSVVDSPHESVSTAVRVPSETSPARIPNESGIARTIARGHAAVRRSSSSEHDPPSDAVTHRSPRSSRTTCIDQSAVPNASGPSTNAPNPDPRLPGSRTLTPDGRRALADFCHFQLRATRDETRVLDRIDWRAADARWTFGASPRDLTGDSGTAESIGEATVWDLIRLLRGAGRVEGRRVVFELGDEKDRFLSLLGREGRGAFARWMRVREEGLGVWDGVLVLRR